MDDSSTAATVTPMATPSKPKPIGRPPRSPEQIWIDFLYRIDVDDGCWNWRGGVDKTGYGIVDVQRRQWRANRYMYHMWYGGIPEGKMICHTCDNKLCVRPNHLYAGTDADNNRDKRERGRAGNGQTKLTKAQVMEIKERYAKGGVTQVQLGKEYGVGQNHISAIVLGVAWKRYLKDPPVGD